MRPTQTRIPSPGAEAWFEGWRIYEVFQETPPGDFGPAGIRGRSHSGERVIDFHDKDARAESISTPRAKQFRDQHRKSRGLVAVEISPQISRT
jgi:hypothetical protein